ncbi:MAG: TIM barrel protein, partial [Candidatus Omnitrophica bacterium]|nr:TIM barrel protein [Candidatus Omnitrophota bacterium]
MHRLGVCIEPIFGDMPYKKRIETVAMLGFKYYEFWFHNTGFNGSSLIEEEKDFEMLAELNHKYGLTTTCFVHCHPDGGIKASLINKDDRNLILDTLGEIIIPLAKKIGCKGIINGSGNVNTSISTQTAVENMIETLIHIAKVVEKEDITVLLEPWNTKIDHPYNFLSDPDV